MLEDRILLLSAVNHLTLQKMSRTPFVPAHLLKEIALAKAAFKSKAFDMYRYGGEKNTWYRKEMLYQARQLADETLYKAHEDAQKAKRALRDAKQLKKDQKWHEESMKKDRERARRAAIRNLNREERQARTYAIVNRTSRKSSTCQ